MNGEDEDMNELAKKDSAKNAAAAQDGDKTETAGGGRPAGEGVTQFPAAARAKACPICGKPVTLESRPFCSKRCADIDLGRWLGEAYRIPAEEPPEGLDQDESAPPDPEPRRR